MNESELGVKHQNKKKPLKSQEKKQKNLVAFFSSALPLESEDGETSKLRFQVFPGQFSRINSCKFQDT